jgi:hypothetical protein
MLAIVGQRKAEPAPNHHSAKVPSLLRRSRIAADSGGGVLFV